MLSLASGDVGECVLDLDALSKRLSARSRLLETTEAFLLRPRSGVREIARRLAPPIRLAICGLLPSSVIDLDLLRRTGVRQRIRAAAARPVRNGGRSTAREWTPRLREGRSIHDIRRLCAGFQLVGARRGRQGARRRRGARDPISPEPELTAERWRDGLLLGESLVRISDAELGGGIGSERSTPR
jgi:hypothetical protein